MKWEITSRTTKLVSQREGEEKEVDNSRMIRRGRDEAEAAVADFISEMRIAEAAVKWSEVGDHIEDHEAS